MQFGRLKRREFVTLLGGAATTWSLSARSQAPSMPVVGYLSNVSPNTASAQVEAIRQGLAEAGFVEDRNLAIEYRWGDEHNDRLPELAADLVRRQVAVIMSGGISATLAAKAATKTIPIVFNAGVDPVERGLVASLSRPGGNLTGVSNLNVRLEPKRLEVLHEALPNATRIGLLVNPTNPLAATINKEVEKAAGALGIELAIVRAAAVGEFEKAFTILRERGAGGLVIGNDGLFINRREELGALTARQAVPAIFQFREFAAAGGLISYGGNSSEPYRLLGLYAARILKGEKAAELPVQQFHKVELFLNLKTASALGITFPLTLLGRADEVIE
jgi:putative ABC transport system substrate-binding protein